MENEKKKGTRGGARPGAGRKHSDNEKFSFKAGGVVKQYIKQNNNMSEFINTCISEHIEREKSTTPDFGKLGEVYAATDVKELELNYFDISLVAGFPIPLNNDERAEKIELLNVLCPHQESSYLIRVQGESMIDADIHSGDILVVDKSMRNPREHEPAVCELNGDYTVKFVRRRGNRMWLVPANDSFSEIEVKEGDSCIVWGVVTYVIHKPRG